MCENPVWFAIDLHNIHDPKCAKEFRNKYASAAVNSINKYFESCLGNGKGIRQRMVENFLKMDICKGGNICNIPEVFRG
jgi:hypothetical protein